MGKTLFQRKKGFPHAPFLKPLRFCKKYLQKQRPKMEWLLCQLSDFENGSPFPHTGKLSGGQTNTPEKHSFCVSQTDDRKANGIEKGCEEQETSFPFSTAFWLFILRASPSYGTRSARHRCHRAYPAASAFSHRLQDLRFWCRSKESSKRLPKQTRSLWLRGLP